MFIGRFYEKGLDYPRLFFVCNLKNNGIEVNLFFFHCILTTFGIKRVISATKKGILLPSLTPPTPSSKCIMEVLLPLQVHAKETTK